MKKPWSGRLRVLTILFALLFPVLTAYGGIIDFPENSILFLSSFQVDLGSLRSQGQKEFFENEDALLIILITGVADWQILLSGEDFTSGEHIVPLRQLEWKTKKKNYKKMPKAGREVCIIDSKDYEPSEIIYAVGVSYRLELTGDEMAGSYRAPLTVSMIIP